MKQDSRRASPDSLSTVQGKFERWRRSRTLGTRIPEALWRAAVEVGREHGVSKTAQELRLDYYALKERLESAPGERSAAEQPGGRGFLEIPLCAPSATLECVLELDDGQGARLRVELKGAAPTELETLARAFWSVVR
jgi:hypothetical protein